MDQEILDQLNSAMLSTHRSELPQIDGGLGYPYTQVQNFPKNVEAPNLWLDFWFPHELLTIPADTISQSTIFLASFGVMLDPRKVDP